MDKEIYLQRFMNECYTPSLEYFNEEFDKMLHKNIRKIENEFKENIRIFSKKIKNIENKNIRISFLLTSIFNKSPSVLYELYDEDGFAKEAKWDIEFDANYIFELFYDYQKYLIKLTKKNGLISVIKEPYIISKSYDVLVNLLFLIYSIYKRILRNMDRYIVGIGVANFLGFNKSDIFSISVGEYMDWQKTIFAQKLNVDLLNSKENEDLTFREFNEIICENRKLNKLKIEDCVFNNCNFKDIIFEQVNFMGTIFNKCTFTNCTFIGSNLLGVEFNSSVLKNCKFKGIELDINKEELLQDRGVILPPEIFDCLLKNVKIEDIEKYDVQECDIKN